MYKNISAKDLHAKLKSNSSIILLDVREKWEYEYVRLENAMHIPLGNLRLNFDKLDKNKEIIVYCHHGVRSIQACFLLDKLGFIVYNLDGGINAWAHDVDKSMKQY
ncbi:MAG: rhodanese-like domain-containing protein [Ignavibacteria bacterium]|nr:rhodanese-like domain-containing protein [Ignavibacteria bacterium]